MYNLYIIVSDYIWFWYIIVYDSIHVQNGSTGQDRSQAQ